MKRQLSLSLQMWTIGAIFPLAFAIFEPFRRIDFYVLWVAGKMALSGGGWEVYDPIVASAVGASVGKSGLFNFPYPPNALFFVAPFSIASPFAAYLIWNLLTAALFYVAARPWLPQGFPPLLAVLTPAALICLDFGQTGLLLGALWLLAFRGNWPAVGLLTFKPHLGVLSILSLKGRRDLINTALLVLALGGLSAAVFGPAIWTDFIRHSLEHAGGIGTRKRWLFGGVTPAIGYGFLGWIPFAAAGLLLLARNVNAFTAATASLLVSPYGFHYDMPVACLGFGLLIFNNWDDMPITHRIPIALGFLSPVISLIGAWWIPPILTWSLWVQTKYAGDLAEQSRLPRRQGLV